MEENTGDDVKLKYFTETGHCTDEIKLLFDDGKVLYVSENLMAYASPVFKAMFDHNCKEKKDRAVKLAGKKYEEFQEFLLCLHPAVQKGITKSNVLFLAGIAEEYQVALLIFRCKKVMCAWLDSNLKVNNNKYRDSASLREHAASSLKILHKALECRYEDVVDKAIKSVCQFGYGVFSGRLKLNTNLVDSFDYYEQLSRNSRQAYITFADEDVKKSDCYVLFENLPGDIKYKLLTERLILCDSNNMIGVN